MKTLQLLLCVYLLCTSGTHTDMEPTFRSLQRRHGCWMFGRPGLCGECTLLISAFCALATIDLLLAVARSMLGTEATAKSKRLMPPALLLHVKLSI